MAVAIAVRHPAPLRWLHRLSRPIVPHHPVSPRGASPSAAYAANMDRWATLPGEYDDEPAPAYSRHAEITVPGISAAIACASGGPTVLHVGGAWRGHVVFEGSANGRTWEPTPLLPLTGGVSTETNRPGLWRTAPNSAVRFVRVRVVALTAGAVTLATAGMIHSDAETAESEAAA